VVVKFFHDLGALSSMMVLSFEPFFLQIYASVAVHNEHLFSASSSALGTGADAFSPCYAAPLKKVRP
jgi:hypothetical protein